MPPFRCWADLPPEILCCVGDRLDLKWCASARGACTAWRGALALPSPALLVVADDFQWLPYAASLPSRRSFQLTSMLADVRCVGSSNGWLALSVPLFGGRTVFVLVNPVEVVLPPLTHERRWVSKVAFAPFPTNEDFAAAAICAGARRWAVRNPVRLSPADQLTDIIYTDNGKVYCLTRCGDMHLLRLPERHRREPANYSDVACPSEPEFSVLQPPPVKIKGNLHCTIRPRSDHVINDVPSNTASQGPHMNAPATVEPLLSEASLPFNPTTVFALPYHTTTKRVD